MKLVAVLFHSSFLEEKLNILKIRDFDSFLWQNPENSGWQNPENSGWQNSENSGFCHNLSDKIQKILDFDILDFADIPRRLYIHACVHACLLAGGNVIDGAPGQVINVSLLENPYS